ncbi:MAG: DNA-directed RNA polymerase sigma-70 factor [Planctomycetota bacterium]|nr:MAG: DNA-directed RNA polymerase sigma-70 factor [Planctomycetota bacterium]
MEWVTTTLLLDQLSEGDEAAWTQFAERFRIPVTRFVQRLGVPAGETDDVVQETLITFLDAFRRGRYDRSKGRLGAWLFGIAAQSVRRHGRRSARDARQLNAPTLFWEDLTEQELRDEWELQWDRHVFERCLAQVRHELRPETVRAFELVTLEERSAADVAESTGLSTNAVYLAKRRVLQRIQELREEHERVTR